MDADETLKSRLYDLCLEYAKGRLDTIRSAMSLARESANEEGKSSAGDKHETGRSMAQLEQEKLSEQLREAEKSLHQLGMIPRGKTSPVITAGSLVITDKGNYFIAISAGKLAIDGELCFAVSPVSPIGRLLLTLREERAFILNGQQYSIKKIC